MKAFSKLFVLVLFGLAQWAQGEAMIQYFNTDYRKLAQKIPELAELGYGSIWLPPPTKGSGGLSVGYDLWDRFDLGSKDQNGSIATRYGTEAELLEVIRIAHRFNIRIYFDNIMNHNAFDIPGFNETVPIDVYNGFVPEDFHLRVTEDGFYRKWDNTRDWKSAWQVQNLGLADLIDIAHEEPNTNFGKNEGDDHPKYRAVRQAEFPEYYLDTDLPMTVFNGTNGFTVYHFANKEPWVDAGCVGCDVDAAGNEVFDWVDLNANGQHESSEVSEAFTDTGLNPKRPDFLDAAHGYGDGVYNMGNPVSEDVNGLLIRSVRWLVDRTSADGLRLDAVKHVPDYFFGSQGGDKDYSNAGYLGGFQEQFNLVHGYNDWDNHRNSVFDTEVPRDDGMVFGEHLGEPPGYAGYVNAGMRLVDNDLRSYLNSNLSFGDINNLRFEGAQGFGASVAVMHAQSHDNDYVTKRDLQHAIYFTRTGLPLIYTDGNYHAETLGDSGGAFPRHANTTFLGQFNNPSMPNIIYIHEHFARGGFFGWDTLRGDMAAWERLDYRDGASSNAEAATMLFMANRDGGSGHNYQGGTSFPNSSPSNDAYLYNYSYHGGGFYVYASAINTVVVPPDGFFLFSYRTPEEVLPFKDRQGPGAVEILDDGQPVGFVSYMREDGPDGDPAFNPHGVFDTNTTDYAYEWFVPRITNGSNLTFIAHADGSAADILLRLDNGIDLNGFTHSSGDVRDNPPANVTDVFLGFERAPTSDPAYKVRLREKFAATNIATNVLGSPGAASYETVIGSGTVTDNASGGPNPSDAGQQVTWVYHEPANTGVPAAGAQYVEHAGGVDLYVKVGYSGDTYDSVWVYYTTDGGGNDYPEGSFGSGTVNTKALQFGFYTNDVPDGSGTPDWWTVTIPSSEVPNGTELRYKIGVVKTGASPWFPGDATAVSTKSRMETRYTWPNINARTAIVRPHGDFAEQEIGLEEGFHIVQSRAFLERAGGPKPGTSLYNTFKQTFYYDIETPTGEIKFPSENDTVGSENQSEYEMVIRTDSTVTGMVINIEDQDVANDDSVTGLDFANGMNTNGFTNWVMVSEVSPTPEIDSEYPLEWRFKYRNIATNGAVTIRVRLLEISSTTNMALDSVNGHYTELVRNVNANGPDRLFRFDFPTVDGTEIQRDWTMRVIFSPSLGDGFSDEQLTNSFTMSVLPDGATQSVFYPKSEFVVNRGAGTLETTFSQVYNETIYGADDPDKLYEIIVSQTNQFGVFSETTVKVKAFPLPPEPFIDIIQPEEVDIVGNRQDIEHGTFPTGQLIRVNSDGDALTVWVRVNNVGVPAVATNFPIVISPDRKQWDFNWTIPEAGSYRIETFMDTDGNTNTVEAFDLITVNAVKVQRVPADANDIDDDDDGIPDTDEINTKQLTGNVEDFNNGDVHTEATFGETNPLSPDSDLDGLPDGLESGYRTPLVIGTNATDVTTDTDLDGYPNFIPDLDPPFYNTLDNFGSVPEISSQSIGGNRRALIRGSVTDPNNPDSDSDGILDGIEDWNRNGWVDGDGASLPTNFNPFLARDWPNGEMDAGETWTETDPNNPDTDGDGLSDGFEDGDKNGWIAGDSNSNRVYDAGEAWAELDPLQRDTDGDLLPDGWELTYDFDGLDNGTDNLGTTTTNDGQAVNGSLGDPDMDGLSNLTEFQSGTHPRQANTGGVVNAKAIFIGAGPEIGQINGKTYYQEFLDWDKEDLLVLDEYEGNGFNNQGGDIFPGYDGFDSSRDIVAFYFRDGGAIANGGTDELYFRLDFNDLQAFAEDGALNVYVVIDTGNPNSGEKALPDEVDLGTEMQWEVVVAMYDGLNGVVYADANPGLNTINIGQDLIADGGVQTFGTGQAHGFLGGYFNSELDAVEFGIKRSALTSIAGWSGLDPADLNFQVFVTRDDTCNSCNNGSPGAGDIGGRNDIRDTIYDDRLADEYWKEQPYIAANGWLTSYFGKNGFNDIGKCARVGMIVHGNQAIQPGSVVQDIINDGAGAGYFRLLDAHRVFKENLNLHLTPTMASAIEWASVDPAASAPWRDGPSFNDGISELMASNVVHLLGSTFSDHMLPYFNNAFNADNVSLANEYLTRIYGIAPSPRVFWTPERLANNAVFEKVAAMGYTHTIVDQMRHILKWYGRTSALSDEGYKLNRTGPIDLFVINDFASGFLYDTDDKGLSISLRQLFNRKARSGTRDQLTGLFSRWEEFQVLDQAEAYDQVLRWMANHPWIDLVSLDEVAQGLVDISEPPDQVGDVWSPVIRSTNDSAQLVAQDFIDHASQESYDNWYFSGNSPIEEGLSGKQFNHIPGQVVPLGWGVLDAVSPGGVIFDTWNKVNALSDTNVSALARAVLHASVFQTAFHTQANDNAAKFSTGEYIYLDSVSPDDDEALIDFARFTQTQTRFAGLYEKVAAWASAPPTNTVKENVDIDQDGATERLLYNAHIFAVLEPIGGRMTAAFVRDAGGRIAQVVGNFVSYSGSDSEYEGESNVNSGEVSAYRTSALKDWFAQFGASDTNYVNDVYTVTDAVAGTGWLLSSSDSKVKKTITLGDTDAAFNVAYDLSGIDTLYVRHGLSPHLADLLVNGQQHLQAPVLQGSTLRVVNLSPNRNVTVEIGLVSNVSYNAAAIDDDGTFDTLSMRNQAQTLQVELLATDDFSFTLGFDPAPVDTDGDEIPDWYEMLFSFLNETNGLDAAQDEDIDGVDNLGEYIAGTGPDLLADVPMIESIESTNSFRVEFPTKAGRQYEILYRNHSLIHTNQAWVKAVNTPIAGDGSMKVWVDDGTATTPDPDDSDLLYRAYRLRIYQNP